MVFKVILGCILTLYSVLSLFAFLTNKTIKMSPLRTTVCVVSCVLIFISNAGLIWHKDFFPWTLVAGIILLQVIALRNGFLLYGRPNWRHHIVRLVFSVFIIWLYVGNLG